MESLVKLVKCLKSTVINNYCMSSIKLIKCLKSTFINNYWHFLNQVD